MVKEIEIYKASSIDGISSKLIKDAFQVLTVELTHLFNHSIDNGDFPISWAVGHVTPIPKEGNLLEPGNWRPIVILPLPSKLLEKAVHSQVVNFFDTENLLGDHQHGFRKSFSTSTAIFKVTKDLFENYDKGKSTSCMFIDYKKAFETLDHNILLQKMSLYNFSRNSLNWFKSYLANRTQIVKVSNHISSSQLVEYGVPQGSTLGPMLFIIYVNDLLLKFKKDNIGQIEMYADDTVTYVSDSNPKKCLSQIQKCLDTLVEWCTYNKLTINIQKTKHMFVPRYPECLEHVKKDNVVIAGQPLHNTSSYKYLGVVIDSGLSFETMLDDTYNKANRKLYILKHIRPFVTNSIASLIYKTCKRPILDYADFLVESGTKAKIDNLQKIQKRAIRCIDYKRHPNADYGELLDLYGIELLHKRRRKHHLTVMYRHAQDIKNLEPFRPVITLRSHNKIKFKIHKTALTKVQKSPYNRGVSLWDHLPLEVQKATTKVKFKKETEAL